MLMLHSAEFVALCRAQVVLLTQALGASLSVVYLTQELADSAETQLIPIVAYPETAVDWQAHGTPRSLTAAIDPATPALWVLADPAPSLPPDSGSAQAKQLPARSRESTDLSADNAIDRRSMKRDRPPHAHPDTAASSDQAPAAQTALVPERRIVLPLMHEAAVLGLLVTERNDRPWTDSEQAQIHQIAETLAIARILDQRYQWLEQDQRQQLQARQHDLLDNLLHQFRNSLTTLQTFGKLILKRLSPDDGNRDVAASLVRETSRLRDLAQQLEWAVVGTEALPRPSLALPPALDARSPDQPPAKQPLDPSSSETQQLPAQPLPLLPAAGFLSGTDFVLEPCLVTTVLEPLLAAARAIAQERLLTLRTDIPTTLPPVSANVPLLREVLSNAIDNALKYTPSGGQVLILARLQDSNRQPSAVSGQQVEIAITDTGPGIPPEDLPHIFERRYRGVQAQTEVPGSGLGLAIARALVTQMQGEICVFSPAQVHGIDQRHQLDQHGAAALTTHGRGTTVAVRLAIADPLEASRSKT